MSRALVTAVGAACLIFTGAEPLRCQDAPGQHARSASTDEMAARRQHWAWQPLTSVEPPSEGHPVDAFLAAALAAQSRTSSP